MSAIAKNAPAPVRSIQGQPTPRSSTNGTVRFLRRARDWVANMRWRDGLAIAFTVGAVAGSAAVVGHALPENNRPLVIVAALTALLTVAGQTAIRREMFQRLAESRKYWFRSSPRGLAEVDSDLQFVE